MTTDPTLIAAAAAIRAGSKSFAAASRLFDRHTRESATLLYAWCRHCDDVVDGQQLGHAGPEAPVQAPAERLLELERKTRAALAGEPTAEPPFAALGEVVRRHAIPARHALEHLAGFRMDVEGRRYATLSDTLDYAYHVAGVVGIMMAQIMGVRDPAVLDRACDLGLAFQLTNMARDIVEDAEAGRVYLPGAWLDEAGIPQAEVADPRHRARLAPLAARLVDAAEPFYLSAATGIAHLPPRSAWAIASARHIYRAIGLEVKRRGPGAWDGRVSTSSARKLAFVLSGGVSVLGRFGRRSPPPRPAYSRPG
ncbi:phytoene/squalene synthase family protein [Enterovirga sp.]|uniref:phytoene/squalene synthase family protein n=1 Tax=Enterovirga sp. TaxID=2026350 RepID=UPI002602830D|nr:phytoene/squalene synthase family protein [Enterovirga sp.]MDB5591114.1 crtB [Enterovirga sp.]